MAQELNENGEVPRKKKRIKKMEVMVADVIIETHDTTTLVLFTGNDHMDYRAGNFLTIDPHQFEALGRWTQYLEDIKGKKEKPRAYSLASAPHEKYLAITIKEEEYITDRTPYPPLLSPVLVRRTPKGTHMEITGFAGPYYLPDDIEDRTDHIVHICAGSGIVPNYSMIKSALHHDLKLRHTLVYGNKTWDDIIYRDALHELAAQHPDKIEIVHAISREANAESRGPNVHTGRVTLDLLRKSVSDWSAVSVFTCGPALTTWDKRRAKKTGEQLTPRFLESVLAALKELDVTKQQLHKESYG